MVVPSIKFKNVGCTVCTINCVSFQTLVPMDPVTILLAAALVISSLLFLLTTNKKKTETARRLNKLPGPTRLPILGTSYLIFFINRRGKKFCRGSLNPSRMHVVVTRTYVAPIHFITQCSYNLSRIFFARNVKRASRIRISLKYVTATRMTVVAYEL